MLVFSIYGLVTASGPLLMIESEREDDEIRGESRETVSHESG